MEVALSITFQDRLYYCETSDDRITAGSGIDHTLLIPDLEMTIVVQQKPAEDVFVIQTEKSGKVLNTRSAKLYQPIGIEKKRNIAVLIGQVNQSDQYYKFPREKTVRIGRTDKEGNQIAIKFPFVSESHFELTRKDGEVCLSDNQSKNGIYLNGQRINAAVLKDGDVLNIYSVQIRFQDDSLYFYNVGDCLHIPEMSDSHTPAATKDEKFTRSPRLKQNAPTKAVTIQAPPSVGSKPEINWLSTLLPVGVSIAVAIVTAVMFSPTMLLMTVPATISSVVLSIVNYHKQKKTYASDILRQREIYEKHLEQCRQELLTLETQQRRIAQQDDPSPAECLSIAQKRSERLWARTPTDEDFLSVRLGIGSCPASYKVSAPQGTLSLTENTLLTKGMALQEKFTTVANIPIVSALGTQRLCGVIGRRQDSLALVKTMLLELCTNHYPEELKVICICDPLDAPQIQWTKELPHLRVGNDVFLPTVSRKQIRF